ncbi:MAG: ABC transporter substrate-binding protein [Candidatus Paceibacterota bacterium]|jgi:branched-chain amino acid transport system substrate-binding protein
MSKTIKIIIGIVIIVLLGGVCHLSTKGHQKEEVIKIGFIGPLSGNSAVYGELMQNVVEITIKEINSIGGVNGKKLKVVYEDGKCNEKDAITAVQKLLMDPDIKIVLPVCATEVLGIAPTTQKNKILTYVAWSYHPDITNAGSYIFRNTISDRTIGELLATDIYKKEAHVGLISEQTDYPIGIKNVFTKKFKELGGTVYKENFLPDAKDMRVQIIKILSKNINVVFLNPNTPIAGTILLKQLKELGYKGTIYFNAVGSSPQIREMIEAQNILFYSDPYFSDNQLKKHILDKYFEENKSEPAFEYPVLSMYDVLYTLSGAIKNVGEDPTKIKEYLLSHNFTGAVGDFHYDENGDLVGAKPSLYQIKNGKQVWLNGQM